MTSEPYVTLGMHTSQYSLEPVIAVIEAFLDHIAIIAYPSLKYPNIPVKCIGSFSITDILLYRFVKIFINFSPVHMKYSADIPSCIGVFLDLSVLHIDHMSFSVNGLCSFWLVFYVHKPIIKLSLSKTIVLNTTVRC